MLRVSLNKVKLSINVNRYIRSIVLTDVLHVLQIKENLISVIRL